MNILHLCLACFYIDGYNYQENVLPRISKEKGHNVKIIASTETYIDNYHLGYVEPGAYFTESGIPIVRLSYKTVICKSISRKIRKYKGLVKEIEQFNPDIIFSHDLCFESVKEVVKYVKENPKVVFLSDTHSAEYNSGMNWLSHNILHKIIYKSFIKKALPYIKKLYYIGPAERDFSIKMYGVPEDIMEFLPLGGRVFNDDERLKYYDSFRKEIGIHENELALFHTGKLANSKKTVSLLDAFIKADKLRAKLVIIGSIADSEKEAIMTRIKSDSRILYLGWKDSNYLTKYLCACDLYCQPGSPSATLLNAICSGCAVMARPMEGYKMVDTGNFLWIENETDILKAFHDIELGLIDINQLKANSLVSAKKFLDYDQMEERICEQAKINTGVY